MSYIESCHIEFGRRIGPSLTMFENVRNKVVAGHLCSVYQFGSGITTSCWPSALQRFIVIEVHFTPDNQH